MSFQKTSLPNSIRLDEGYILIAAVQTADKAFYMDASLDLNTCLGNLNGMPSLKYLDFHFHSTKRIVQENMRVLSKYKSY